MARYRKRPVIVDAIQIVPGDVGVTLAVSYFLGDRGWRATEDGGFDVDTLEGTMHASPGDWIIRGVKGEHYPCKPDIFEATYEAVAD